MSALKKSKHVVLIAGEESGDEHAAKLIRELRVTHPEIQFSGIGGNHMQEAGATLVANLAQYGVTGFTDVIRYFRIIRQAFHAIKNHLQQVKPDLLILVDYPGFNLRLAQYAKETLGLKIIYYISPQIWAWKAKRIHKIKKYIDHMAVIFPFEQEIYEQAGVPVDFVGHPLIDKIPKHYDAQSLRKQLGLPEHKKLIAFLPGSRTHEIERHMPVLIETLNLLLDTDPNIHCVIPIAGTIAIDRINRYLKPHLPITTVEGRAIDTMAASDFVIVASGTASLESALLKKPMCIIYKSSVFTSYLAMKLIKIKYLGLCNILSKRMLVPEFLQYDCNAQELSKYLKQLWRQPDVIERQVRDLSALAESMSREKSECSLSTLVARELH